MLVKFWPRVAVEAVMAVTGRTYEGRAQGLTEGAARVTLGPVNMGKPPAAMLGTGHW